MDTSALPPGQHAARLAAEKAGDPWAPIATFCSTSPNPDPAGRQVYYSEIDVETAADTQIERLKPAPKQITEFPFEDKAFKIVLDSTASPICCRGSRIRPFRC